MGPYRENSPPPAPKPRRRKWWEVVRPWHPPVAMVSLFAVAATVAGIAEGSWLLTAGIWFGVLLAASITMAVVCFCDHGGDWPWEP